MNDIFIGDIVVGVDRDYRIVIGKVLYINESDSELTYFIETLNKNYHWLITDTVQKIKDVVQYNSEFKVTIKIKNLF